MLFSKFTIKRSKDLIIENSIIFSSVKNFTTVTFPFRHPLQVTCVFHNQGKYFFLVNKGSHIRQYSSEKSKSVYKAQIIASNTSQGHKILDTKTKNIRSRYPSSIQNILVSRKKHDSILMHSHLKGVLYVLYLICHILYNKGTIYVVGYKTQLFLPLSFYGLHTFIPFASQKYEQKPSLLSKQANYSLEQKIDAKSLDKPKHYLDAKEKILPEKDASCKSFQIQQENWCASSLSNWQKKSPQLWRTACFLKHLQDFALKNSIDFSELRKNKSSLMNQLITIKTKNGQKSYMPFLRQPDLLIIFDAESKRSVLKQAKNLQIPTILLTNSNMDTSDTLYSLPGNHKSIHLLYSLLDSFSLLCKITPSK